MGLSIRKIITVALLTLFSCGAIVPAVAQVKVVVVPLMGDDAGSKWRGDWSDTSDYEIGDIVFDLGSSYIATSDHTPVQGVNDPQVGDGTWDIVASMGATGPQGDIGLTGSTGLQGVPGVQGPQGLQGEQGLKGDTGPQGETGDAGANWRGNWSVGSEYKIGDIVFNLGSSYIATIDHTAVQGVNDPQTGGGWELIAQMGVKGDPGVDGVNGETGPQGIPGPEGPQGVPGEPGGPIGPEGPAGPQGIQGIPGLDGMPGAMGPAGADSIVPGPQGAVGDTGPAGPEGPQGIQGIQGIAGQDGAPGETGPEGPQGIQGILGLDGTPGEMGPAGADSTVPGPQGVMGDTGLTGPEGPQGIQGIPGLDGAPGATGPEGPQGIQGIPGQDGATGPQGIQGISGATGAMGPAGPQGVQGVPGMNGLPGATGPAGADSTVPGPQGAMGDTGPVGPAGADGVDGIDASTPENIIWVAKSGGDYSDPVMALNAIGVTLPAATANNPYLIHIAPGVYTLSGQLILQSYVALEGSGQGITVLRGSQGSTGAAPDGTAALVLGANHASLRELSVENLDGSGTYSIGLYNNAASTRLSSVTIKLSGGQNQYGVYNKSSANLITDVSVNVSGGSGVQYGYISFTAATSSPFLAGSSTPFSIIRDSQISASTESVDVALGGDVIISNSVLSGVATSSQFGGQAKCAFVFLENGILLNSVCE